MICSLRLLITLNSESVGSTHKCSNVNVFTVFEYVGEDFSVRVCVCCACISVYLCVYLGVCLCPCVCHCVCRCVCVLVCHCRCVCEPLCVCPSVCHCLYVYMLVTECVIISLCVSPQECRRVPRCVCVCASAPSSGVGSFQRQQNRVGITDHSSESMNHPTSANQIHGGRLLRKRVWLVQGAKESTTKMYPSHLASGSIV